MPSLGLSGEGNIRGTLAMMAIIGVLLVMAGLTFVDIPAGNKDLFNMGFGAMIAWSGNGFNFFLGSSQGSKDKTAAMTAEMARDDEQAEDKPEVIKIPARSPEPVSGAPVPGQ